MTEFRIRGKLDEEERKLLSTLRDAADDGEGNLVHVTELQRLSGVVFLRTPLDRLKRRGFVDHDGARALIDRFWKITDAGREAIS